MSRRLEEKPRRRAEREARERPLAARERRTRRLRLIGAVVLAGLVLAGLVALTSLGSSSGGGERPARSSNPFGQHYAGLERRRVGAGVSTMASPTANVHTHPHLAVWANGRRVPVPADVGIDPREDPGQMAGLHTHDDSGTIHNEGQADATLGQFFAVWGVPFSKDRVGPYRAGRGRVVQMWVNGEPSRAWGSLSIADGQDIRIVFGPKRTTPPTGQGFP